MAASIGYIHKSITLSITRNTIWEVKHKDQLSCDTRLPKNEPTCRSQEFNPWHQTWIRIWLWVKIDFCFGRVFLFYPIYTYMHTYTNTYICILNDSILQHIIKHWTSSMCEKSTSRFRAALLWTKAILASHFHGLLFSPLAFDSKTDYYIIVWYLFACFLSLFDQTLLWSSLYIFYYIKIEYACILYYFYNVFAFFKCILDKNDYLTYKHIS